MAEIAIKTPTTQPFHSICCNDSLYLNVHVLRNNGTNQISMWWDCQICTEKWGSRHEKLSMRPITGKPHAQVQTKIQSTVGLCVPSLELASHRTMLNPHLKNTLFFWLSQPPLILYSIIYYIIALEAHWRAVIGAEIAKKRPKKANFAIV